MAEIQYDPACMRCRIDAGRDVAGTTWQCYPHVQAERDSLWLALAEATHEADTLKTERNAALTLAEQRGAAYDMTWREVESLREGKDKLEAERIPAQAPRSWGWRSHGLLAKLIAPAGRS